MNGITKVKARREENFLRPFFTDAVGIHMLKLRDYYEKHHHTWKQ